MFYFLICVSIIIYYIAADGAKQDIVLAFSPLYPASLVQYNFQLLHYFCVVGPTSHENKTY